MSLTFNSRLAFDTKASMIRVRAGPLNNVAIGPSSASFISSLSSKLVAIVVNRAYTDINFCMKNTDVFDQSKDLTVGFPYIMLYE